MPSACQMLYCSLTDAKMQICQTICNQAIYFFRHPAVETALTCLDMSERNVQFAGNQSSSQGGVGISPHDNKIRAFP